MDGFTDQPPFKWKTVRVFISSTFRDFHAERDYLIKYVFPELRQWCEKQKLHLIDIDLRWGVTEKEAESGKVIELCLEQIDGCRPFFICMLGNRYGWIPNEIERNKVNEETLKNFPDLKLKWENLSVTHLEILHAALSPLHGEEPVPHSFFYFRDKKSLPGEDELTEYSIGHRKEYLEAFLEKDSRKAEKLDNLKKQIIERFQKDKVERVLSYTPKFDTSLSNPEDDKLKGRFTAESLSAFGNKVKEHLLQTLETQFAGRIQYLSEKREEASLANERELHEAFIENRTTLFIGRTELLQRLHDYVNSGSNKILAVYGESGSGKSALLAKFYREYKFDRDGNEINRDMLFIPHFIGASPSSTSLNMMLRRFCEELFQNLLERQMEERLEQVKGNDEESDKEKETIRKEYEIPFDPRRLELTFKDFLGKINSRVIILIDGLNQLDESDRAQELDWLPYELPGNVKIIASTLEGRSRDSLKGLTNEQLDVGELDNDERREIIREMPSVFAKTLEEKHINVLFEKSATSNPLYLKVALEELRIFGSFEKLEEKINVLPDTVIQMFIEVLERLEREVDKELVKQMFCLLECSRYGLSAIELEELLHDEKKSHFIIIRQLRDYFISKEGLFDFFHRGLSKAVRQKYRLEEESLKWHRIIAGYFADQKLFFEKKDKRTSNFRKLSELPFQQTKSKMWSELYITLTDTEFLEQKNTRFRFYELLEDYRTALREMPDENETGKQRNVIQVFSQAMDQASFVLKENPDLTFPQLYNRIQWQFDKDILLKDKLETEKSRFKRPWLRLISRDRGSSALVRTFKGHAGSVFDCAISPDGTRIVSASRDNTLKLWEVETGIEISTLKGHTDSVEACDFSPNGRLIVSGSMDKTLKLWDAETCREIYTLEGHAEGVTACSISPNGEYIISASWDNTLKLWNLKTGKEISTFEGHKSWVNACAFSPDSRLIVSESADEYLKLWDVETGKEIYTIPHAFRFGACAFSPDGRNIVSGDYGRTLKLWDVKTGNEVRTFIWQDYTINACAFSPDGKYIVSANSDNSVGLWDVETGKKISSFTGHADEVTACTFSRDGRRIISASDDETLRLWDVETGEGITSIKGHNKAVKYCGFNLDGKRYISTSKDKDLKVWDGNSGVEITTIKYQVAYAISPDGQHIASASDDKILLWDGENGKEISTFKGYAGWVQACAFSPDGKHIVSADRYSLNVWDVMTGKRMYDLTAEWEVKSCAFSPDGRYIAFICSDYEDKTGKTFKLWNGELIGKEISTLKGHSDSVNTCVFSPDGRHIISGSTDKTLKLWDMETGEEISTLEGHTAKVTACAFSLDGRRIVSGSGDKTLKLWDVETCREISTFEGHSNSINTCAFSPDGKRIVSGSSDKTLRLWDIGTGEEIASLKGHTSDVISCSFSPDGNRIISGDRMGQVILSYIENIEIFIPIVNSVRVKHCFKKTIHGPWDENLNSICHWCGLPFPVSNDILNTINAIQQKANLSASQSPCLHLPDSAWKDPGLMSECPHCHKSLVFNPFVVDNKDRDLKRSSDIVIKFEEDILACNEVILDNPHDEKAYFNIGLTFEKAGQLDDAIDAYKSALIIKPDYWEAYYNLGLVYQASKLLAEAIFAFQKAVEINPYDKSAYFNLGLAYREQGNSAEANHHFKHALDLGHERAGTFLDELEPEPKKEDANIHFKLGYKYQSEGKFEEAIQEYKEAIRIKPNHAPLHFNLGLALRKQGIKDEAKYHFKRASDLGDEDANIHLEELKLEIKIENAEAHFNLGEQNWQDGKIEDAINEYREAIRIDPDHVSGHFNLGSAYLDQDRLREAFDEFNVVIRIDPNNEDAHCALGIVFGKAEQYEKAISEYTIAIQLNEDHSLSHFNLGLIYLKLGMKAKARLHFKRALVLGYEQARPYLKKWWQ